MQVETLVNNLVHIMAVNRAKYDKRWKKIRTDRLASLVPLGDIDEEEFLVAVMVDERFKQVRVLDNKREMLVDAVQLRYDIFRKQINVTK